MPMSDSNTSNKVLDVLNVSRSAFLHVKVFLFVRFATCWVKYNNTQRLHKTFVHCRELCRWNRQWTDSHAGTRNTRPSVTIDIGRNMRLLINTASRALLRYFRESPSLTRLLAQRLPACRDTDVGENIISNNIECTDY